VGHAVSELPAEVTAVAAAFRGSLVTRSCPGRPVWHGDCIAVAMSDDKYVTLLLWTICVLTFACSVVALTEHPEWFGA
jgi:hypothetical protein